MSNRFVVSSRRAHAFLSSHSVTLCHTLVGRATSPRPALSRAAPLTTSSVQYFGRETSTFTKAVLEGKTVQA